MSDNLKYHLVSAGQTFLSAFLTTLGTLILALPHDSITQEGWAAVLMGLVLAAVRAGVKALIPNKFA